MSDVMLIIELDFSFCLIASLLSAADHNYFI